MEKASDWRVFRPGLLPMEVGTGQLRVVVPGCVTRLTSAECIKRVMILPVPGRNYDRSVERNYMKFSQPVKTDGHIFSK